MGESERFRPPEVTGEKEPASPEAQEKAEPSKEERVETKEAGEKKEEELPPDLARLKELGEQNKKQRIAIETLRADYQKLIDTGVYDNIKDLAGDFSHITGTLVNAAEGYRAVYEEELKEDGEGNAEDLARVEKATEVLEKYLIYFEKNRQKFLATNPSEQDTQEIKRLRSTFDDQKNPKRLDDLGDLLSEDDAEEPGA